MDYKEKHFITCEYPPSIGGVSDYAYILARALAERNVKVHVWCPKSLESPPCSQGIIVHQTLGKFRLLDLIRTDKQLNEFQELKKIFIHYVPHGYKLKAMNVPFCLWVLKRRVFNKDVIELMIHEPFLRLLGGSVKESIAAIVQRLMMKILLTASSKVYGSTPKWEEVLKKNYLKKSHSYEWLPISSSIKVVADREKILSTREKYAPRGCYLVGHLSCYNRLIRAMLKKILPQLLAEKNHYSILLIGRDSLKFKDELNLSLRMDKRVFATGELNKEEISSHLSACDVMLQPLQDGINGRYTSILSCLAHGKPIVSNYGRLTEEYWFDKSPVKLSAANDYPSMVKNIEEWLENGMVLDKAKKESEQFYNAIFNINQSVSKLAH